MNKILLLVIAMACILEACKKSRKDDNTDPLPPAVPQPPVVPDNWQDTLGNWKIVFRAESGRSALTQILFPSITTGYVVDLADASNGTFRISTNSGKTWSERKSLPPYSDRLFFLNENTGFSFRTDLPGAQMGQTFNKGELWYRSYKSNQVYTTIRNMSFPADTTGYAMSQTGEFIKVTNPLNQSKTAFQNLGTIPGVGGRDGSDISFPTLKSGWVAIYSAPFTAEGGFILVTKDGGLTWEKQLQLSQGSILSLYFLDDKMGWATTGKEFIYRTVDGGANWEKISIKHRYPIFTRRIVFINSQRGFLISTREIFESNDGGVNWTRCFKTAPYLNDIAFARPNTMWAVSDSTIYKLAL